jgi:fumarate reductase flavoprotein subunit
MASSARIEQAGLIVVGASAAGLVAAIAAADHGHRVVLIERSKDLGGLAATSAESIAAAGTRFQRVADIVDAPDRLRADLAAATPDHGEPELADAVIAQGAALVEWLADRCGVQVVFQSTTPSGGHGAARLHSVGEQGGASLIPPLVRAASHHTHIRVRTATEVERLVPTDEGGVSGVALRPDRRGNTVITGPVVLASGGFVGNDELVARYCPDVKDLPYMGPAGAKGDSLQLAAPLGAALRHGTACAATALLAQPSHLALSRAVVERGAILVSQRGVRFADESQATLPLAAAVRAQPGRVAYLLFDEQIATEVGAHDPFFARVVLPRTSRRASSIGMLAKQLELPEAALTETLQAYSSLGGGNADAFGRRGRAGGLVEPYYGVRVTGARLATRGGLAVDAQARVLDESGNAIANLYAVGGAATGLAGDRVDRELAGMDALAALGLARVAALGLATVADDA